MIPQGLLTKVFAYAGPADMRKGYEGLSALVRMEMGKDPLDGGLFLFTNRRRNRAKALFWDGTGLCILSKRLEQGQFPCLWDRPERKTCPLSKGEFLLFLEGCKWVGRIPLGTLPLEWKDLTKGKMDDSLPLP